MNSKSAIEFILSGLRDDDIALFTTGYISRHAFAFKDRSANFYMIGSMGLVSSVGLGMAANTRKKVFIFDGDGSILMDMGTLAMIAHEGRENIFHIVLDNGAYASTGGQPSISRDVDLAAIARSSGYRYAATFESLGELENDWVDISRKKGPAFILLKVKDPATIKAGRVLVKPADITKRLRSKLICKDKKDKTIKESA